MPRILIFMLAMLASVVVDSRRAAAQYQEEQTVLAATAMLGEAMGTPGNKIPASMLADAHGVAIIPQVIKGSFVVGARHGKGLLFVREQDGVWHAPVFITLTGGNVGWQVGVQSSDVVLVFKTQKSVQGILSGKLTLGADAAAAAGPVGRQGSIGTDGKLQAEVYSYSRSRGLFAGVSIDGSVLKVDSLATGSYYKSPAPGQPVVVPPSAMALTQTVASITGTAASQVSQQAGLAAQYATTEPDVIRAQLLQLAPELFKMVDPQWRAYLALPADVMSGAAHPDVASLQATVHRYDLIAVDGRFQTLAARPEFQSVHALLKHYVEAIAPSAPTLNLPAPPPNAGTVLPS